MKDNLTIVAVIVMLFIAAIAGAELQDLRIENAYLKSELSLKEENERLKAELALKTEALTHTNEQLMDEEISDD